MSSEEELSIEEESLVDSRHITTANFTNNPILCRTP